MIDWRTRVMLAALAGALSGCGVFGYAEPTEEEVDKAVRAHIASYIGDGTISNPINNVHMNLHEVRKLGCEKAGEGTGYFCTYSTRMSLGASSNETSQEGRDHAAAANLLMQMMSGGGYGVVDQNTHRFIKGWGGWELVQESPE